MQKHLALVVLASTSIGCGAAPRSAPVLVHPESLAPHLGAQPLGCSPAALGTLTHTFEPERRTQVFVTASTYLFQELRERRTESRVEVQGVVARESERRLSSSLETESVLCSVLCPSLRACLKVNASSPLR